MSHYNASYSGRLAYGESFEQKAVKLFRSNGFKAARWAMELQELDELSVNIPMAELKWGSWKRLYTLFQRDIWVKVPKEYQVIEHGQPKTVQGFKRFNIEVKARKLNGFCHSDVWVGRSERWDILKFKVHYFIVIDQDTKEVRWIDVKATQDAGLWKFVPSSLCKNGYLADDKYAVPTEAFRPIVELYEILSAQSDK